MAFISKKSGDYEKVIPVVLEEYMNGVSKKTIANNHKIDIAIVVSILNSNKNALNRMRENRSSRSTARTTATASKSSQNKKHHEFYIIAYSGTTSGAAANSCTLSKK